jgi:hypothetical protein
VLDRFLDVDGPVTVSAEVKEIHPSVLVAIRDAGRSRTAAHHGPDRHRLDESPGRPVPSLTQPSRGDPDRLAIIIVMDVLSFRRLVPD